MSDYSSLILFDWFSVTSKIDSEVSFLELLGLDITMFQVLRGARGYKNKLYFEGINLMFGGRDEVWLEMSGAGCRTFESFSNVSWSTLFDIIVSDTDNYNITRLDVAFDDREGYLDLQLLFNETDSGHYVSKFRSWQILKSDKGITIYHGSEQSSTRFRIYDKAKERKDFESHWVRFEIQLRDSKALNFLELFLSLGNIGHLFVSVINNVLRYVVPSKDSNNRRWKTALYWSDFIGYADKISLYTAPKQEYNLEKLERYAVNQAGTSVAAYMSIVGEEKYIEAVKDKLKHSNNPKYREIVEQYKE